MAESRVVEAAEARNERWSVKLIGPLQVMRADGNPCRLAGRRERALLAYLALAPEFRESRRNLVTLLWGDEADNLTLDNLRTCLWSLRKALGDDAHRLVEADRDWIRLNPALVDIDARQPVQAEPEAEELLQGLDLDTVAFQDWARAARARHADAVCARLACRMAALRDGGDMAGALASAEGILRLDPYDEAALRAMLEILGETGRRNLAVQAYRRFAQCLQTELGAEPEPETIALIGRITAGTVAEPGAEARAVPRPDGAAFAAPLPAAAEPPGAATDRQAIRRLRNRLFWAGAGLAMAAVLAMIGLGAMFWRMPELAPAPFGAWVLSIKKSVTRGPPTLSIRPFRSRGDRGAEEFADALVEGLTDALAMVSEIFVVSSAAAEGIRDPAASPQEIAHQLNVRYVLEGSVTRKDDTVQVTARLVDTANGGHIGSLGTFERPLPDFFALQREIIREVVTRLQVRLTEGEQERVTVYQGTRNYEAWLYAGQGHTALRSLLPDANIVARHNFNQALARDSDYTGALTGLAWTYLLEVFLGSGDDKQEALTRAASLAARAQKIDDSRAATHALLGVLALFNHDTVTALREGKRAFMMEPNDADSAALYALTLTYTGSPEAAIPVLKLARQIKPYPPRWYLWLDARAHRHAGRYDEAIGILTRADVSAGRSYLPLVELALAYVESGRPDLAVPVVEEVKRRPTGFFTSQWAFAPAYTNPAIREREVRELASVGLGE